MESSKQPDGMRPFRVTLVEKGGNRPTIFDCEAVSTEGAKEFAGLSFPGATIISVMAADHGAFEYVIAATGEPRGGDHGFWSKHGWGPLEAADRLTARNEALLPPNGEFMALTDAIERQNTEKVIATLKRAGNEAKSGAILSTFEVSLTFVVTCHLTKARIASLSEESLKRMLAALAEDAAGQDESNSGVKIESICQIRDAETKQGIETE